MDPLGYVSLQVDRRTEGLGPLMLATWRLYFRVLVDG